MVLNRKYLVCQGIAVLLVAIVLVSGCISLQFTPWTTPAQPATPEPVPVRTAAPTPPPPATLPPAPTAAPLPVTSAPPATITGSLPYGVTITYPEGWLLEETGVEVIRDYGRTVFNIANLFSPAIGPVRAMPGPNPDRSQYTILTVDVDPAAGADLEDYFNKAVLALQDEYGSITITRHSSQLSISGYRSYQLDFDAEDLRASYIFTKAGSSVYIFSFSNPSPYSAEVEAIYRSLVIAP
jgi:hypothetical protein